MAEYTFQDTELQPLVGQDEHKLEDSIFDSALYKLYTVLYTGVRLRLCSKFGMMSFGQAFKFNRTRIMLKICRLNMSSLYLFYIMLMAY